MSRIFEEFVGAMNQVHESDLKQMGATIDWEELDGGERMFGVELSRLGIGVDRGKHVLYTGVEFSAENLIAPPGQSAKTKTILWTSRLYKGGIVITPILGNLIVYEEEKIGPLAELLRALNEVEIIAYLVGPFNQWDFTHPIERVGSEKKWMASLNLPLHKETLAKIAIPLPKEWRVEWDSGHHALGYVQSLSVWPIWPAA